MRFEKAQEKGDGWMYVRTGVLHAWPICRSESGKGTRAVVVVVKIALERQIIKYCSCMLKKLIFPLDVE